MDIEVLGRSLEPMLDVNARAIRVWNFLSNGMGGFDAGGLPVAVELFEVDDVDYLATALVVIKHHKPRETPGS